ncbi:hypothetical protein B0H14DRAFT_2790423 [Mycena olivaceomarginata]|nr:hypothetical protein B0H14DRAFT_2790423 [Mycena olivaceomarginata]
MRRCAKPSARDHRSKRRPSTGSQVRHHKRLRTEIPVELRALLIRREAANALAEKYDAGEISHGAYPLSTNARRRSLLIPHLAQNGSFHPPIEPTAAKIPNPYSNMWKTVCRIHLFQQNRMLTGSRLPVEPTSDLNDIFPAEFTPKGTPIDPNRQYPWAAAEQMSSRPTMSLCQVQVMDYVLVPPAPYGTPCLNYNTPPSGAVVQTCRLKYRASRSEDKEGVPIIL